nr:MAG: putative coat protein [Totiviridae sp.]
MLPHLQLIRRGCTVSVSFAATSSNEGSVVGAIPDTAHVVPSTTSRVPREEELSRVMGSVEFLTHNLPHVVTSSDALTRSAMFADVASDMRTAAIETADGIFLRTGSGAGGAYVRSLRRLDMAHGARVLTPVALPVRGAAHEAPWVWRWRRVYGDNVEETSFAVRSRIARLQEESGFDASYQRFRRYDSEGILGILPALVAESGDRWLSWLSEIRAWLAYQELDANGRDVLEAGIISDASAGQPGAVVPDFHGIADERFFGSTVGRSCSISVTHFETFEERSLLAQGRGAQPVRCPVVGDSWLGIVTRKMMARWVEEARNGRIGAEVFVSRARSPSQLLGDMLYLWAERYRAGNLDRAEGAVWILAPHVDEPIDSQFRWGRMVWRSDCVYSWRVVAQLALGGQPEFAPIQGTSRDVLALVRYLASIRVPASLPTAQTPGGYGHWQASLGSSSWQIRLLAAMGFVRELGARPATFPIAGGSLANILAFEGVRLGRGFDRVWQRVCGSPDALAHWGPLGESMWDAAVVGFNALYACSGHMPLGVFFTPRARPNRMSAPGNAGSVRVRARTRWGVYGWPVQVPNEWDGIDERGAEPLKLAPTGLWDMSQLDRRKLQWALAHSAALGAVCTATPTYYGVPVDAVEIGLEGLAAADAPLDSFEVPVEWLRACFAHGRSSGFSQLAEGAVIENGVIVNPGATEFAPSLGSSPLPF